MRRILPFIALMLIFTMQANAQKKTISYLALGDSYTIGESVPSDQNFPSQLAGMLRKKGIDVKGPDIVAKTGWTTDELMKARFAAKIRICHPFDRGEQSI
jgi:lysophospholipase L1-like esterase